MAYIVEDFIEQAHILTDRDALFTHYIKTLKMFGFETAIYSFATDHLDAGTKAGHALQSNFPSDWLGHYFENKYESIDPVIELAHSTTGAFAWEDIPSQIKLSHKQELILNEAQDGGLLSGVGIPLHGARGELAGMGLAGDIQNRDFSYLEVAQIQIITQHFHQKYCDFGKIAPFHAPQLSPKETEVLQWMADGKSVYDTSIIMGIAAGTVKFHRQNIFTKLDACNKTMAIVKALRFGLIALDKITLA